MTDEQEAREVIPPDGTEPPLAGATVEAKGLERLVDVELRLSVEIGVSRLPLRDVLQLGKGSIVELDRDRGDPADLFINGRRVGRGEVTTVDDRLAVRIVDLNSADANEIKR